MSMPITNIAFVFRKEDKEKILNKIQEWDRGVDKEAERKSHPHFQTAMDIYRDAGKVENDHYFLLCWKGVLWEPVNDREGVVFWDQFGYDTELPCDCIRIREFTSDDPDGFDVFRSTVREKYRLHSNMIEPDVQTGIRIEAVWEPD